MALEYRRRGRKNLGQEGQSRLDDSPRGGGRPRPSQGIVDSNPSSTYFNITDIPSYLGTGKNTIRLLGSSLLRRNSQIEIEVIDAIGNPIYHEIPNFLSKDGGRLISIWVYSNRTNANENTAPGEATIIIKGKTKNNVDVVWTKKIPVRVDEKTSSEIIFDEKTLPTAQVSSSLRPFASFQLDSEGDDLGQGRKSTLTKVTASFNTKYLLTHL